MIFFRVATLEQDPAALVDEKNGKSPVQKPRLVDGLFFGDADRPVPAVYEDEILRHAFSRVGLDESRT